jgi:hypothetical protein
MKTIACLELNLNPQFPCCSGPALRVSHSIAAVLDCFNCVLTINTFTYSVQCGLNSLWHLVENINELALRILSVLYNVPPITGVLSKTFLSNNLNWKTDSGYELQERRLMTKFLCSYILVLQTPSLKLNFLQLSVRDYSLVFLNI